MGFVRGRWNEQYINCIEDKKNYDNIMRGRMYMHHELADKWCEKYEIPDLSREDKTDINSFWEQYGIHINNFNYHRMYYYATGMRDPRFVPDYIAGHIVYSFYNDHAYEYTWRDKNMFERLLPNVPLPHTYASCCRNRFQVNNRFFDNISEFASSLYDLISISGKKEIIIKPTRNSGFGRGVKKYVITQEDDVYKAIHEWEGVQNYIVQEYICQHSILASFNESSSNMIRVCSWRHGNSVDILFAAARIGIPGAVTDVSFVNGEEKVRMIGISKDGYFDTKIVNQDGFLERKLDMHYKVPAWENMISIIKSNHLYMDNFDIVGWDFTVDENENPICFEWNIQWPGTVLYQYVNGPLWGDFTDILLGFLKDKDNQYNYIPWYLLRNK